MKCPNCGSPNICHHGTMLAGLFYDRGCNKCGYVWNLKREKVIMVTSEEVKEND